MGGTQLDGRAAAGRRAWSGRMRIWILLGLLVSARLLLVSQAKVLHGDDGERYLTEAVNLLHHRTFSAEKTGNAPQPTAHDVPVYPLILAGCAYVTGNAMAAGKLASILNCFLFGIAALAVYKWTRLVTGSDITGTIAAAIFGLLPESISYSVFYMPDTLFVALFVWSLVYLTRFLVSHDYVYLRVSFALWAATVLTKPLSMFWGAPMMAMACYSLPPGALFRRRNIANLIACAGIGVVIVAPWLMRNYAEFGTLSLTSITGTNLFEYNYAYALEDNGVSNPQEALSREEAHILSAAGRGPINPLAKSQLLESFVKRHFLAHPLSYVKSFVKRHPRLYLGTATPSTFTLLGDTEGTQAMERFVADWRSFRSAPVRVIALQMSSWIFLFTMYGAALAGFWKLFRHGAEPVRLLPALAAIYFALLIGPVIVTRYRMSMSPSIALAAAAGFRRFRQ